jgi:hypothetical protein
MSAQATQTTQTTQTTTAALTPPTYVEVVTGAAGAGAGAGAGAAAAAVPAATTEVPFLPAMVDLMMQTEQEPSTNPLAKAKRRAAAAMSILDALERHHFWDPCLPAVLAGGKTMKTLADAVLVAGRLIVPAPEINPEAVMVNPASVFARFLRQAARFKNAISYQHTGYEQLVVYVKRILQCVAPWTPSGARANALARQQAQSVLELVSCCTLPALKSFYAGATTIADLKTEYLWAAIRALTREDAHAFMQAISSSWFEDVHTDEIVGVALKPEAPEERARLFTELLAAAPKFANGKGISACVMDAATELLPLLSDDLLEQLVGKARPCVSLRVACNEYFKFVLALVKAKPAMKAKVVSIVTEMEIPDTCKAAAAAVMAELLL